MELKTHKAFLKYNLRNNFKNPAFYVLTILFSVFLSLNYFIRHQFFTGNGTTDLLLFFSAIPYISIVIIPALCYKQSFSNYDSFIPLKNIDKIVVVFLSRLILFSIMLIVLIPSVLMVNLFGSLDLGQFFVSFIYLFFYGAAVISLCSLLEKLFDNKIVVFLVSAVFLGIFNSAHLFTVYVQTPDFITVLCKQLSFAWHFDSASKGIFDTRDFTWFIGSTVLFIFLADYVEEKKKGKQFSKKAGIHKTAAILLSLLIMLNGTRYYSRIDFSTNKTYSPSKYTKELLSKADQNIKITYYRSGTISKLYPQIRDVSDFLITYSSLSKNITLIIKDPDKNQESRTLLENYGIQSQQLQTVSSTSTEYVNVYSTIVIEHNGNVEILPFTMSATSLEYDLDTRIKHLVSAVPRTVNIIIGNGMSLTEDYSYLVPWLESKGFICNPLYLSEPGFVQSLENSTGLLLVIGDEAVKIEQAIAIEDYILKNKGNALFMVSPYTVDIEENWYLRANKSTNIVEILENWGVLFDNSIAADISCSRITMYADDNSETQVINYPLWLSLLQQKNASLGATLFWATPIETQNNAVPYLQTTSMAYKSVIQKNNKETLIETNPFILQTENISNKEKQTLTVGAEITGPLEGLFNAASTSESHIIVLSDQYFLNTLMSQYIAGDYGDFRNFELTTTMLLELNNEHELSVMNSKTTRNTSFYKVSDMNQFAVLQLLVYVLSFGIIPLIILITGVLSYVLKK